MLVSRRAFALAAAAFSFAPRALAQAPPPRAADDPRPRSYARLGGQAAEFELPRLGGGVARLSNYRGQTLILYFGGLWCPDCIVDGANVNRLAARVAAEPGVSFLNIHTRNRFGRWGPGDPTQPVTTQADAERALNAYFAETGYRYPVAIDASRTWAREAYEIAWYPTFLIVDRSRTIRAWRTDLGAAGAEAFLGETRRIARERTQG